jgi:hypothetical protein
MDYFTRWPETYTIPNQEASTVVEALVTNFCRGSYIVTRAVTSDLVWCRSFCNALE